MSELNDPTTCGHQHFDFALKPTRFPEQRQWMIQASVACTDCHQKFFWYGVNAIGVPEPGRPATCEGRDELRIFIGPEPETIPIPDEQLRQ